MLINIQHCRSVEVWLSDWYCLVSGVWLSVGLVVGGASPGILSIMLRHQMPLLFSELFLVVLSRALSVGVLCLCQASEGIGGGGAGQLG
jgi:hypothetical protein